MESKNDLQELRGHLFDSIRALRDGTMDVKTAKTISDIGRTLMETARVELDHRRLEGSTLGSAFIGQSADADGPLPLEEHKDLDEQQQYGQHAGRYYARVEKQHEHGITVRVITLPKRSLVETLGADGVALIPEYDSLEKLQRVLGAP